VFAFLDKDQSKEISI